MGLSCRKAKVDGVLESDNHQGTAMTYVDIVTALALLQFIVFGIKVGMARGKYGVEAPAVSGNPIFERTFRVQMNTLELLVTFVPGLFLFGRYVSPLWGAGLGVVYLVGREIYSASYVKDPAKRSLGYALTALPTLILIVGGLAGALWQLLRSQ
jgi:glutathione S-transferase